uniref:Uncharacterized protein n=1 Tax=Leptospirillum ferriphilum TaxID=178606 RepID=A0A7C3QT69_9BACT
MSNRTIPLFCLLLFCLLASWGVRQMNLSPGMIALPDKVAIPFLPEAGRADDGESFLVDTSRQTDDLACPHLGGLSLEGGPDTSLVCNHSAGALSPQGKDLPPLLHSAVSLFWTETFGVRLSGQDRWHPSIPGSPTPPPR